MTSAPVASNVRHAILGTAGHIDHGKSSLVKALTGTDPDRLPEEKTRGMTIDLGFAHLDLPGIRLGIVDVPGHERFVRTMVAGATGIDLAALLVAADDGVMPQTREHIEILDLLGVTRGVFVISKRDLADADRLRNVERSLREAARGTALADWPAVAVSALRGDGLDDLMQTLANLAAALSEPRRSSVFRMAIDRVFTIRGRGTVVTGSVLSGSASVGQTLELMPRGVSVRVREIQSHGSQASAAMERQRAALNITGVDREQIARGDELATPGCLAATRYLDARVRLVARRERPLPTHRRVRACLGTREEMAVLVCLEGRELLPGRVALVQLRFNAPVVAAHGQRFVIRDETAQHTLGGGLVLRAVSRRLRAGPDEAGALHRLEANDPLERLGEVIRVAGFAPLPAARLACQAGIEPADAPALMERLRAAGRLERLGSLEAHAEAVSELMQRAQTCLTRHHARTSLEPGILHDRFVGWLDRRSAAGLGRVLLARLMQSGSVVSRGPYVARADFRPALSADDAALLERLIVEVAAAGLDPPEWGQLRAVSGLSKQRSAMLMELVRTEPRLVQFGPGLYVGAESLNRLKAAVDDLGRDGRRFKLAEVRDRLQLSRRSVLPLLEYLDRIGYTRRVGDERIRMEARS